jgi:hypothetical protein
MGKPSLIKNAAYLAGLAARVKTKLAARLGLRLACNMGNIIDHGQ